MVRVNIVDVNDNAPVFNSSNYTFKLSENTIATPAFVIGRVLATDPDEDGNQPVC